MPPFMTLKYNTLLKTENIVFFFIYLARKYTFVKSALDSIRFFSYKNISGIKHHIWPFGPERYPVQEAK